MSNSTTSINKLSLIVLLGFSMSSAPLAIDMYLPALPAIAEGLNADIGLIQHTLSVFLLGFAFSQLIYGPISDSVGRKPVMLVGLVIYACASLLCAVAETPHQLILFRLLQSLGGGALAVIVLAIIRDLYIGNTAARIASLVIMTMTFVPLVAPLIGAHILVLWDWRAIFIVLTIFAAALFTAITLFLPETLSLKGRQPISLAALTANYRKVIVHKQAVGNIFCAGFSAASMFAFISGSPYLYIEYFGLSPKTYGLLFAGNILLFSSFCAINANLVNRLGAYWLSSIATKIAVISGLAIVFFAYSGIGGVWSIAAMAALLVGLSGPISANAVPGATEAFGESAGSASALLGFARFMVGACAAALVGILHNETPLPMAWVMAISMLLSYCCNRWLCKPISKKQPEIAP